MLTLDELKALVEIVSRCPKTQAETIGMQHIIDKLIAEMQAPVEKQEAERQAEEVEASPS